MPKAKDLKRPFLNSIRWGVVGTKRIKPKLTDKTALLCRAA